ncbi:MAG: phosphoribosyl transferase [Microbacteriaceae bacterium]|nr:phosphoribosyl transferase [Microbacteriaceae bacterium]HEV7955995.1 phosphoribosyltransferase family protein [Marisediminicola sp.]
MFADRTDAGKHLAKQLAHLRGRDVIVLGLPRGGVPVAAEVAAVLDSPLDVLVIRKLGAPGNTEYAIGAIGEGGVRVVDEKAAARIGATALQAVEDRERAELARRLARYRPGKDLLDLRGKTVVIVDDGVATGSSASAACQVARRLGAERVVLAVPVAPRDWTERFRVGSGRGPIADEFVATATPSPFFAVGQFYESFAQTTDDEVLAYLDCLARRH